MKAPRRYDFLLSDGTITQFTEGNFVMVDSMQGPGLWACGRGLFFGGVRSNSTRIPFENIKKIEEHHFSVTKTALWVGGIYVGGVLITVLMIYGMSKGSKGAW